MSWNQLLPREILWSNMRFVMNTNLYWGRTVFLPWFLFVFGQQPRRSKDSCTGFELLFDGRGVGGWISMDVFRMVSAAVAGQVWRPLMSSYQDLSCWRTCYCWSEVSFDDAVDEQLQQLWAFVFGGFACSPMRWSELVSLKQLWSSWAEICVAECPVLNLWLFSTFWFAQTLQCEQLSNGKNSWVLKFLVGGTQLYTLLCRSVGMLRIFLNSERFSHCRSCQTIRDWIVVYSALLS